MTEPENAEVYVSERYGATYNHPEWVEGEYLIKGEIWETSTNKPGGIGVAIYRSRSRLCLWRRLHPPRSSDGHSGSADRTTIALAERLRGEAHRFDPQGLS